MKLRLIYACFIFSFMINMALSVHLLRREPVCDYIHRDEIDRTKDVIPDEETAVRLAREKWMDPWLIEGYPYEYQVFFNEPSYEWIVFINLRGEDRFTFLDGENVVWLRRDYGFVSNYCR